jgi:hypothetical protein
MSAAIPPSKPNVIYKDIEVLMKRKGYDQLIKKDAVFAAAIRGYYLNTMGQVGKNDLGMYDDMVAWVWPNGIAAFNYNTDPSRVGYNANAGKNMAMLVPGMYTFVMRKHKGKYDAFGQGDRPVAVYRVNAAGTITSVEEGLFGINIHEGGQNGTSSEGCQTLPRGTQWQQFKSLGYSLLRANKQETFKYILFDEETERKIKRFAQ